MTHDTIRSSIRKALKVNQYYRDNEGSRPLLEIGKLDEVVRLYKGVHVVAARSGVGKSAFKRAAIRKQLRTSQEMKIGVFSFEMDPDEIITGFVSAMTDTPHTEVMEGGMPAHIIAAYKELETHEKQLFLRAGKRMNVKEVQEQSREWFQEGVKIIYIDYLQKLTVNHKDYRIGTNENVLALADLAQELSIPIVCLAQLNRGSAGQRPAIHHLQESSLIEQEAKTIILLDRFMKTEDDDAHRKYKIGGHIRTLHETEAIAIIAKNRFGETGIRRINWAGKGAYFH